MSSSSLLLKDLSKFVGIPLLIVGCVGGLLNVVVFVSLKTFRKSACGYYLTLMSIVNVGQLLIDLLNYILKNGYSLDLTLSSRFVCKLSYYLSQWCALVSLTCLCLSTIDQYLKTHIRQRYQQLSSIEMSFRLSLIGIIVWLIHGIVFLIYFDHHLSSQSQQIRCMIINRTFQEYYLYFYTVMLTGYLPVILTIVFGCLAYRNVRQISYRTIPMVRQQLDKQLTTMVLLLDVFNVITLLPYPLIFTISSLANFKTNPNLSAKINLLSNLTFYFYYLYFAVSRLIRVEIENRNDKMLFL